MRVKTKAKTIRLVLVFLAFLFVLYSCLACSQKTISAESEYGVFLGVNPEDADILSGYDTVVIDAAYYTKDEITAIRQSGAKKIYTYLNIGSIETFREDYASLSDCALAKYENWPGEYWVDVARPEWQAYIERSAKSLVEKGVDGFFLDNADVYYLYPTSEILQGLVTILNGLSAYNKDILINGGDVFVSEAVLSRNEPLIRITGVNQECVFTNIDFANNTLIRQDADTSEYYKSYLEQCKEKGLMVYLTEYAKNEDRIEQTIREYCGKQGYLYYISPSIGLDG